MSAIPIHRPRPVQSPTDPKPLRTTAIRRNLCRWFELRDAMLNAGMEGKRMSKDHEDELISLEAQLERDSGYKRLGGVK